MSTTADDYQMIVWLAGAGSCSLDSSPKKNWVENAGGLPNYICKIAKAVMRSGKSKSAAIAIAISRTKKWAAGGDDVDADTRAKAAKAVAEWEALKGKNKAGKLVKASRHDGEEYVMFSNVGSFNTDMVRRAWDAREQMARSAVNAKYGNYDAIPAEERVPYSWVKETWTDFILVSIETLDGDRTVKVPYDVDGMTVTFHDPIEVKQVWVEAESELTDEERSLLEDLLILSEPKPDSPEGRIAALGKKLLTPNGLIR